MDILLINLFCPKYTPNKIKIIPINELTPIFSFPFLIFNYSYSIYVINWDSIYAIIYLGIFPTAIAFQFRYYITKTSGPVFLSYVAYLIPAFAVIWGYILLSEKIGINSFIGILLILIGVYIGQSKLMSKISKKYV